MNTILLIILLVVDQQVDVNEAVGQLEDLGLIFRVLLIIIFVLATVLIIIWREYKNKDRKLLDVLLDKSKRQEYVQRLPVDQKSQLENVTIQLLKDLLKKDSK